MTPRGEIVEGLTWEEALRTDHRLYLKEQQSPSQSVVRNFTRHAQTVWAPMRKLVGPMMVTSGYRCEQLNHAVGGAANSRHVLGLATDNVPLRMDLVEAFDAIAHSEIPYDVIIFERSSWIHIQSTVSASATPRRLKLMMFAGKTEDWNPSDPRVQKIAKASTKSKTPVHVNGTTHVGDIWK